MIQAGTASEIITPARGIPLAGYFDPRPNRGAHDDLKVKVTLFRQGDVVTGFVSYDLCFICMNIIDAVRKKLADAGFAFGNELIFHATHSHTAPYPAPFFGADCTDKAYLDDLADACAAHGAILRTRNFSARRRRTIRSPSTAATS